MALFMTQKKKEKIGDEIDELQMHQYHCRCRLEEAKEKNDQKAVEHEMAKIEKAEAKIEKLRKKIK